MAYPIPTLATIVARVKGDLNSRMGNTNALVPRSLANILAYVIAGGVWGLYLYQSWIGDQVFPDTAEMENLTRLAANFGITPTAAAKATGSTEVTGAAGSELANGSVLERGDGERYLVVGGTGGSGGDSYVWSGSGAETVDVEAEVAGASGNAVATTSLTLVSPPAGIVSATVANAITGGADAESEESLRARLIARLQEPPQGGAIADYVAWVYEAADLGGFTVAGAWAESWRTDTALTGGQVAAHFIVDGSGTGDGGYIPTAGQVTAVRNYITTEMPATAELASTSVTAQSVTLAATVTYAAGYDGTDAADELETVMRETFLTYLGVSGLPQTLALSRIQEAFGRCVSIDTFTITDVSGGGAAALTVAAYKWPTIDAGDITLT